MMRTHSLKTWPEHFEAIRSGRKKFELRLNDRGYEVGDVLELIEWNPTAVPAGKETGRRYAVEVTFALSDYEFGVRPGFVALSIKPVSVVELPGDPFGPPPTPTRARHAGSYGPPISANFEGICPECEDEIEVGDSIRMGDDGAVHRECVSA